MGWFHIQVKLAIFFALTHYLTRELFNLQRILIVMHIML